MAGRQRNPANTDTYSGRLAAHVDWLREARGLTVEELAAKTSLPLSTLYAYLGGTRGIPADVYPQLAKALGVTAEAFLPSFRAKK